MEVRTVEKDTKVSGLRLVIYLLGAVGTLVLLLLCAVSLGWFTGSSRVEGYAETLAADNGVFELAAADKNGYYDALLNVPNGELTNGVVAEDGAEISLTATTDEKPEIKWMMNDESNFGNLSDDGIQPGSSGKLTFYVIARQNTDLRLTFRLDKVLYDSAAEPISNLNPDNSEHIIPKTETAARLADGHILFFGQYDEESGVYSERITDVFTFTQLNASANTAYRVDFYWVWPLFVDQLVLPANDPLLRARGYDRLTESGQSVITQAEDTSFFAESIQDLTAILENIAMGSNNSGFDSVYYDLLNAKWNEADQIIGTNAGYIELLLTAELSSAETP